MKVRFEGFGKIVSSSSVIAVSLHPNHPDAICFSFSSSLECKWVKLALLDMGVSTSYSLDDTRLRIPLLRGFAWVLG